MFVLILLTILLCVQDPKVLAALQESRERQAPYAGAFLLKDEPDTDPNVVSSSDTEKNVYDLKGKELFNRLHEVGTLAQVCYFICSLTVSLLPSTNYSFRFGNGLTFVKKLVLNSRFQVSRAIR